MRSSRATGSRGCSTTRPMPRRGCTRCIAAASRCARCGSGWRRGSAGRRCRRRRVGPAGHHARSRSRRGLRLCPAAPARAVPAICSGPSTRARRVCASGLQPPSGRGGARLPRCRGGRGAGTRGARLTSVRSHGTGAPKKMQSQTGSRSRISRATAWDSGSVWDSSAAMTRGRSAAGRFWLSLCLPSSRVTAISNPMMPFNMVST